MEFQRLRLPSCAWGIHSAFLYLIFLVIRPRGGDFHGVTPQFGHAVFGSSVIAGASPGHHSGGPALRGFVSDPARSAWLGRTRCQVLAASGAKTHISTGQGPGLPSRGSAFAVRPEHLAPSRETDVADRRKSRRLPAGRRCGCGREAPCPPGAGRVAPSARRQALPSRPGRQGCIPCRCCRRSQPRARDGCRPRSHATGRDRGPAAVASVH